MNYSSRFFLYAPTAAFLSLAALVGIHWWNIAGAFEGKLAALKDHEAVPGVTLDWSKVTISGFPFRIDAVFDGFSATGAGAHGPFGWQSEHLALHALTYGTEKTVFEAAGNQRLAWTDAAGAGHNVSFLPGSLRASTVRDAKGLERFDLDIIALDGKGVSIGRAQFHMRRDPNGNAIDLMASADVAKDDLGPFGGALRTFRLYQTLTQAGAFAPLLGGTAAAAAADAAWRQAGGTITISQSELNGHPNSFTPPEAEAAARLLDALY